MNYREENYAPIPVAELPLADYRALVEELTETRVYLMQRGDELIAAHMDLEAAHREIAELKAEIEKLQEEKK